MKVPRFFLLFVAVAAATLVLAACGSATPQPQATVTVTAAPATSPSSPAAQATVPVTTSPRNLQLVGSGWFMDNGYVMYGVVIRNPNKDFGASFPTIDIQMFGPGGQVLGADQQVLMIALPGQTIAWGGQTDPNGKTPKKISFTLSVGDGNWVAADSPDLHVYKPFKITGVRITSDSMGSPLVVGMIYNPNAQSFSNVAVSVIARGSSGRIHGGFTDYVSNLGANAKKAFQVSGYGSLSAIKSVDVYAQNWSP